MSFLRPLCGPKFSVKFGRSLLGFWEWWCQLFHPLTYVMSRLRGHEYFAIKWKNIGEKAKMMELLMK